MARSRRLLPQLLHMTNLQFQLLIYGPLQARMPRRGECLGAENPARTLHLDHLLRELRKIHLSKVRHIMTTRSRDTIPQNIVSTLPELMYSRTYLSYADAGFPFTRKRRVDAGLVGVLQSHHSVTLFLDFYVLDKRTGKVTAPVEWDLDSGSAGYRKACEVVSPRVI
jgi:hypothetical protein